MKAIHFGAGNIGRGFIGVLLNQSNYHTTFVDVNEKIIEEINQKQTYNVILASEKQEEIKVDNVSGINSLTHPEQVIEAIVNADIITTAVGPNILKVISELLAKGLQERAKKNDTPLNIIACENMVAGSTLLKNEVYNQINQEEKELFDNLYGFPNAAVDRIVPNQTNEDLLTVSVEPYFEWIVEKTGVKGTSPDIKGVTYVDDLTPYIERKLFTVNTGHAVPAYLGSYLGYTTINEAMNDSRITDILHGALKESGEALIKTYHFEADAHQQYIDTIIQRFKNPYISDELNRVARGPIRKLGAKDRLIRPATMYTEVTGQTPTFLAKVIASVLEYKNDHDEEAKQLQNMIQQNGYEKSLEQVSELSEGHPLISEVMQQLKNLQSMK